MISMNRFLDSIQLQAETSAAVKIHEDAIDDHEERLDEVEKELLTRAELEELVRSVIQQSKDPWWKPVVQNVLSSIIPTILIAIAAFLSGHLHFTWK